MAGGMMAAAAGVGRLAWGAGYASTVTSGPGVGVLR
jgi:hypothetical protein